MNLDYVKKDIKESKLVTTVFILFLGLNIFLTSLALIIGFTLFNAIDYQMEIAKTPHFLQMHQGVINKENLSDFAKSNPYVKEYELLEFLNLDNSDLSIGAESLKDSLQDNGLTTQSTSFDYLLNLKNEIIKVNEGEIYLPLMFLSNKNIHVGDTMIIGKYPLKVAGFLRDSQMNSPLSSSKRFLVHENDFAKLKEYGQLEHLIEFRLDDVKNVNDFENMYRDKNLEANGPTITYALFRMINALSEGLVIAILLLASVIILLITFLCIKFTLLAKMESAYLEIGVLKAIGIQNKNIKKLYLGTYLFISMISIVIAVLTTMMFAPNFLAQIQTNTGRTMAVLSQLGISVIMGLVVSSIVLLYVNKILNKLKKVAPVKALRNQRTSKKAFSLPCPKLTNLLKGKSNKIDFKIAGKAFCSNKSLYATISIIIVLTVFLMCVPLNLYTTMRDKSFATYMGIGTADILIQQKNISESPEVFLNALKHDQGIEDYAYYQGKEYKAETSNGTKVSMGINLGDHSKFPPKYLKGTYPMKANEIAISYLYADELGLDLGNTLTINSTGDKLIITGIYSDITNGGKTAKICMNDELQTAQSTGFIIKVKDGVEVKDKIAELSKLDSLAKISNISASFEKFFGSVIDKVKLAAFISLVVSVLLASFISLLFMKLLIAQEEYDIFVLRSIGFSNKKIRNQYLLRFTLVFLPAAILGFILTSFMGEPLASSMFSAFGIMKINFVPNIMLAYVLYPLLLAGVIFISIYSILYQIKDIKIEKFLRS